MIQSAIDTYLFRLSRPSFVRTRLLGLLWLGGFCSCACLAVLLSAWLATTYAHTFTPYLRWQDALVALLWATAFFSLVGCAFTLRFLYALHVGYTRGVLMLVKDEYLVVRDLSPENLASGFWMMHAAFWCFVATLAGLLPEMLLGWTLYIPQPILAALATGVAILLCIAGLGVSGVFGSFVVVGGLGAIKFCRNLGAKQMYPLNDRTVLWLDDTALTIIYPGKSESMINLAALDLDAQRHILALLRDRLDIHHSREERVEEEAIVGTAFITSAVGMQPVAPTR